MVVPTGVGCRIGGFAGDALPAARLLAAASGCLITHPNVLNAAALYWSDRRLHYVEGWALNRFAAGDLALAPVRRQRVGLVLDAAVEEPLRLRHLQVAQASAASLGLSIGPVVTTEEPLGVRLARGSSGASWGTIQAVGALLRAGERVVAGGATAVAVVARFPDDPDPRALEAYRHGDGVDGLAGAEAVISHLLSRHLGVPCAHAPALAPLPPDPALDPRAAAEELGHTFLPCVLVGLSRAPDLVPLPLALPLAADPGARSLLRGEQLGAVVAPAGALGGEAVLACAERGTPLIGVTGNPCLLQVDGAALGLPVIAANSYAEAAGLVLALREGLALDTAALRAGPLA
ncbi:MAG: DUF3326 domain-containing protein [Cyanobacteriota bacterium]|nr:DUF3326 domain-containing protein [Cyanobacteriota bacterium]